MKHGIKAVILAAGEGTRLKKYTDNVPKGMLQFAGKSLIELQIDLFKGAGIRDIVIVKGFAQDKISFPGVTYYINNEYETTNMVVSLFCAEEALNSDVIVSYADVLFGDALLDSLIASTQDFTVCVDMNWKHYWNMRYGSADIDTESLTIADDRITSLGKENPPANEIDGRYIGLMKFSSTGIEQLIKIWHTYKDEFWDKPWQVSGRSLSKSFMTDLLQAAIDEGYKLYACKTRNNWIEFDTNEDYEKALVWQKNGMLNSLIKM